jgi:hypothetical protein
MPLDGLLRWNLDAGMVKCCNNVIPAFIILKVGLWDKDMERRRFFLMGQFNPFQISSSADLKASADRCEIPSKEC